MGKTPLNEAAVLFANSSRSAKFAQTFGHEMNPLYNSQKEKNLNRILHLLRLLSG